MQERYLWEVEAYKRITEKDAMGSQETAFISMGKVKGTVKTRAFGPVVDRVRGAHGYYGKGALMLYIQNNRLGALGNIIELGDGVAFHGCQPQFSIVDMRRFPKNTMFALKQPLEA